MTLDKNDAVIQLCEAGDHLAIHQDAIYDNNFSESMDASINLVQSAEIKINYQSTDDENQFNACGWAKFDLWIVSKMLLKNIFPIRGTEIMLKP